MMGHKICFHGVKWLIIPKLSLLPFLIWSTGEGIRSLVLLEYDNAVTLITMYISKLYVCLMFVVIKFTLGYYIKEIPYLMSQYTYEYRISSVIRQSIFFLPKQSQKSTSIL